MTSIIRGKEGAAFVLKEHRLLWGNRDYNSVWRVQGEMGPRGRTPHPALRRERLGQAVQNRPHLSQVWKGKEGLVKWKRLERKVFGTKGTWKCENTTIWELWKLSNMQEKSVARDEVGNWAQVFVSHERYGTPGRVRWAIQEVSHTTLCFRKISWLQC